MKCKCMPDNQSQENMVLQALCDFCLHLLADNSEKTRSTGNKQQMSPGRPEQTQIHRMHLRPQGPTNVFFATCLCLLDPSLIKKELYRDRLLQKDETKRSIFGLFLCL